MPLGDSTLSDAPLSGDSGPVSVALHPSDSYKWVYRANTYGASCYAAGAWRGRGPIIVPTIPDVVCFDFVVDHLSLNIAIDGVSTNIVVERDKADLKLIECE